MRENLGINDSLSVKMNPAAPAEPACVLTIIGTVEGVLRGPKGEIKQRIEKHNVITTNGKGGIADQLLASPTVVKPTHMGIGTGTTAAAEANTALVTEVGTRQTLTKTRSGNEVTHVATFGAGVGTGAITEAGIFSAASGVPGATTPMYARVVFSAINKGTNDTLELTWKWTIG